jgi:hypothetical protein
MMMMFVVTPSLESIEHKLNSKSIKFPKLQKVPTLEAININKPYREWRERLRNFGVKPPKRGIELGWVTRGTRPKTPSSSHGFAREARGAREFRGFWGLKTENRKPKIVNCKLFLSFQAGNNYQKNIYFYFLFLFSRPRGQQRGGKERGREGDASTRTPMSLRTLGCVRADAP